MGKITVKHYLNTRAKPNNLTDAGDIKKTYPVYVQIIYKRHSTNKKSGTLIECTIEGFEHYIKTGEILKNEFLTLFSEGYNLEMEKTIITNSIKIFEKYHTPYDNTYLLDVISHFSKRTSDCLSIQLEQNIYIRESIEEEEGGNKTGYREFILSIKDEFGKLSSFESIKKYTKIDLLQFVKPEDFEKFKAIKLIIKYFYNVSFAEFFFMDLKSEMRKLMKDEKVSTYEELIKTIEDLTTDYAKGTGFKKMFAR